MKSIRSAGITAATAAIALSLGAIPIAVVAPTLLAGQDGTTQLTPGSVSVGSLVLSTTATQGSVSWNGKNQAFAGGQQCAITSLDSVHLLDIRGSIGAGQSGTAGFRDRDIGVFEAGAAAADPNNAAQCFRVDSGSFTDEEALTLALGDDPGLTFGPVVAPSATVDLYAKTLTGTVEVATLDNGGNVIGTPTSYTWPKTKLGDRITVVPAQNSSVPFDGIRLTAKVGSFSLRGATFTLVSQADVNSFCPTNSYTDPAGGARVEYLGGGTGGCFGIKLTSGPTEVRYLKPLNVNTKAQFVFDHVWTTSTFPPTPDKFTIPVTYVDFELAGGVGKQPMPWCPRAVFPTGALGLVSDSAKLLELAKLDMEPDRNPPVTGPVVAGAQDTQFACIGESRKVEVDPTGLRITDRIFLIGDARMGH